MLTDLLRRIETERGRTLEQITDVPHPYVLTINGKALTKAVVHYMLRRAARNPSSLIGGSLTKDKE